VQVLAAVDETVWVIDDHGATDQALPAGCGGVASMAVAPNGAFLAVACLDGKLRVMSSGAYALAAWIYMTLLADSICGQANHAQATTAALCQPRAAWSVQQAQVQQLPSCICCTPCVKHCLYVSPPQPACGMHGKTTRPLH
jgi:hypothetical protein